MARIAPALRNAIPALALFCSLAMTENPSGLQSRNSLGGQMPPSFAQDVARVVAEVDRIEADTLSQLEHTTLDRQGQVHPGEVTALR